MGQDLQLFNNKITQQSIEKNVLNNYKHYVLPFSDYDAIYNILKGHLKDSQNQILKIYDYTIGLKTPGEVFPVNDHINRIGKNPFIGKQNFFKIDFINVENLYLHTPRGITTNSCGSKYDQHKTHISNPSTHLANIAVVGRIHDYQIQAYLVNQYIKE